MRGKRHCCDIRLYAIYNTFGGLPCCRAFLHLGWFCFPLPLPLRAESVPHCRAHTCHRRVLPRTHHLCLPAAYRRTIPTGRTRTRVRIPAPTCRLQRISVHHHHGFCGRFTTTCLPVPFHYYHAPAFDPIPSAYYSFVVGVRWLQLVTGQTMHYGVLYAPCRCLVKSASPYIPALCYGFVRSTLVGSVDAVPATSSLPTTFVLPALPVRFYNHYYYCFWLVDFSAADYYLPPTAAIPLAAITTLPDCHCGLYRLPGFLRFQLAWLTCYGGEKRA